LLAGGSRRPVYERPTEGGDRSGQSTGDFCDVVVEKKESPSAKGVVTALPRNTNKNVVAHVGYILKREKKCIMRSSRGEFWGGLGACPKWGQESHSYAGNGS